MSRSTPPQPARRPGQTLAAFVLGLPLAAGLLLLFHAGPLRNSAVFHYVEYPVQWAEVVLFSCALGALLGKFWQLRAEHEACARDILPAPNGTPLPADQAHTLLGSVNRLSGRLRGRATGFQLTAELVEGRGAPAALDEVHF